MIYPEIGMKIEQIYEIIPLSHQPDPEQSLDQSKACGVAL
jgi:hypothetical protein